MADNTKPDANEEEVDFLNLLLTESSGVTLYDVNDPQSLEEIQNIVALNQASYQIVEANRQLLNIDPETGEETYALPTVDAVPIGRTWEYDFIAQDFVMGANNGTPARFDDNDFDLISQWIHRAITTERYRYSAYPEWYGVEMECVFSGDLKGVVALNHIRRTMREAIMGHDRITQVDNIEVAEDGGTIWFSCDVYLDNHEEEGNSLSFTFDRGELVNG